MTKLAQRFLITILGVALAVSLATAQSHPAPKELTAEQWRADVRYLAEELPKRHKNLFHTVTREEFESAVKRLEERLPVLQRHQIIIEMARIVALVGDGHTNFPLDTPEVGFRRYPLRLYLYSDGLFVQAAGRKQAEAVGGRVVKIGQAATEEALRAVAGLVSGDNAMTVKARIPSRLVMPEVLHALEMVPNMEKATFTVEKNGRTLTLEVAPVIAGESVDWVDARDAAPASTPLWLKDPTNHYWFEYLPDWRALYVQYNAVANKPEERLAEFVRRVFASAEANPVERFVLDIRRNQGGNNFLNQLLLHALIRCDNVNQRGKLFTIIGRETFSAATLLAVDLERHTQTLFVGEPTGGRANHYGETGRLTLPQSGLGLAYSWLYWQYSDPRDTRPWVPPHLAAELSSEDYRLNRDPALEAILNFASEKPLAEAMLESFEANDPAAARARYRAFKADPTHKYRDTEAELNRLGYQLMERKRLEDAIEIFQLNVAEYPNSWNVYDSLGEAYMVAGQRELAIRNYEKSLELNPANFNGEEMLKKLRAGR